MQLSLFGPVQLGLFDGYDPKLVKPPALWPTLPYDELGEDEFYRLVVDRPEVVGD